MRPNEIAAHIGAPRSSVYELVNLLLKHGALEYRGDDGQVFLGRKLYFLYGAYAEQFDPMRECESSLLRITEATRETSQLCMLDGNKYTVALMKEGIRPFRISSNVGEALPIPWTASGRLLASHMSDQEIRDFIPPEDFKLPNGAWLKPGIFIQQVREASAAGTSPSIALSTVSPIALLRRCTRRTVNALPRSVWLRPRMMAPEIKKNTSAA